MRRPRSDRPRLAPVLDAGLVLVAAFGAVVLLARIAGALLGLELVTFATGSMTPAFPQGAVAIAQRTPLDQVRVGDVVTIDRSGQLPITHRVIAVRTDGARAELRLRGDANRHADPVPYVVDHLSRIVVPLPAWLRLLRFTTLPAVAAGGILLAALAVVWALWPRGRTAAGVATA